MGMLPEESQVEMATRVLSLRVKPRTRPLGKREEEGANELQDEMVVIELAAPPEAEQVEAAAAALHEGEGLDSKGSTTTTTTTTTTQVKQVPNNHRYTRSFKTVESFFLTYVYLPRTLNYRYQQMPFLPPSLFPLALHRHSWRWMITTQEHKVGPAALPPTLSLPAYIVGMKTSGLHSSLDRAHTQEWWHNPKKNVGEALATQKQIIFLTQLHILHHSEIESAVPTPSDSPESTPNPPIEPLN